MSQCNKFICKVLMIGMTILSVPTEVFAETPIKGFQSESYILMEASSGKILLEHNSNEQLPPASITKVMTMLLIYEAVESGKIGWDDEVTISEYASQMGGSQVFMEPGEIQTVRDLLKCIAIASANDAAVAMGEYIAGSEDGFADLMNKKAQELGMKNTVFKNPCGLHRDGHVSTANDIALLSRELMTRFPEISKILTIWMDSITHKTRRGESEFGLTNTNRLVKAYTGITGLKTGYTSQSKHCITATANRNNMDLIAVVLAAPDSKVRFREAAQLLDYGFANYVVKQGHKADNILGQSPVFKGDKEQLEYTIKDTMSIVLPKDKANVDISHKVVLTPNLTAPIRKGDSVGTITYLIGEEKVGEMPLVAAFDVNKAKYNHMVKYMFRSFFKLSS
ncbi:MAG TPA: D-alanyl-D-alanine carboxypeptidase [Epulopiscium sp.]|nr:D-alanyl-D-alanine carboxypeptidase [Candidatus Epulonipiscium sp.]